MSNPETVLFGVPGYTVYQAAKSAIEDLGLTIESADPDSMLIHFHSPQKWRSMAGEELSMLVIEDSKSSAFAQVSAKVNAHLEVLQVAHWNEGREIARMVHQRMRLYIDESTPLKLAVPTEKLSQCLICRMPIVGGTEFCKACGQARGGVGGEQKKQEQKPLEDSDEDFFAALGVDMKKKTKPSPAPQPTRKKIASQSTPPRPATSTQQHAKKAQSYTQTQLILPCDCGARLRLKSYTKGAKIRCPKCQQVLILD